MKVTGVPTEPNQEARRKLVKELSVFYLGMGALLFAAGVMTLQKLGVDPRFLGYPRNLALGVPTLVLGAWHVASGLAFAVTRSVASACAGAVGTTLLAVGYFTLLALTVGISFNLLMIIVPAMPILAWQRTVALAKLSP